MLPSFLYAGMDADTKRLSAELEALGGGDAKAAHLELHTIIDDTQVSAQQFSHSSTTVPTKESQLSQILWPLGKSVGLRDIKLPNTTAIADCMHYYKVSSAMRVSSIDTKKHSPYHPQSIEIAKWMQSGFNATVVNYGPNYPLKTACVFGPQLPLQSHHQPPQSFKCPSPTLVSEVLTQLYNPDIDDHHIPSVPLPAPSVIAISMWYLQNHSVVDVCASASSSKQRSTSGEKHPSSRGDEQLEKEWLQFASVECPDYETAMRVIQTGRSRCPQSEEHHVFLRVLLYRPDRATGSNSIESSSSHDVRGSLSHLHLVDLVNASSVDDTEHRQLSTELHRISRRDHWLQLNSLWQVMKEMADLSRKSDKSGTGGGAGVDRVLLTSARSSKLTVLLAPLLQGNTKTWFFVHLLDEESQFQQSSQTLKHVDGITDIVTGCYRVKDIHKESLELKEPNTVILPIYDRPKHSVSHKDSFQTDDNEKKNPTTESDDSHARYSSSSMENFRRPSDNEPPAEFHSHHQTAQSIHHISDEDIDLHILAADDSSHFHPQRIQEELIKPDVHGDDQRVINQEHHVRASKNGSSSEYDELMSEFNALMSEVSCNEVPLPDPLSDPVEDVRNLSTAKETLNTQQSQQSLMHHALADQGRQLIGHAQLNHHHDNHIQYHHVHNHQDRHAQSVQGHNLDSQGNHVVDYSHRDNVSLGSATIQSEVSTRQLHQDRPIRHAAHSSTSTDSYTHSYDDFQGSDDDNAHNEAMWDSLDEDDDDSKPSYNDNGPVGGKINRSTSGSIGSSNSGHPFNRMSESQHDATDFSKSRVNVTTVSSTTERHLNSKHAISSPHNKQLPVTASFYDWAANTPKNLSSRRSDNSHDHQHHHPQQHNTPPSPQRDIDVTHQELRESIEKQRHVQELEQSSQRSSRFPYYETVAAIEVSSPHSYQGTPDFENSRRHNEGVNVVNMSTRHNHDNRYQNTEDSYEDHGDDDNEDEILEDSIYIAATSGQNNEVISGSNNNNEKADALNTEIARLEHVNNSLLLALQQEKHERSLVEQRILLIQDNVAEAQTQNELVVESHKIEVLRLKAHIRRLSQENGFDETLQGFEEDMSRVVKEKMIMKKRITVLEEKLFLLGNGAGDDEDEAEGMTGTAMNKDNSSVSNSNVSTRKSTNQHGTSSSTQSLSVVWTTDGISSAGGGDSVSAKEFRILKHKYKRSEKEKDELNCAYEDLKRKERKFLLSSKHADENSRRFKALYAENEKIAEQLHQAMTNLDIKTQEVELLKHEAVALQEAERNIRHERSSILHELSVARQRLRENEAELKDQRYRNRFISKHGYATSDNSGGRVGPGGHHHQNQQSEQSQQQKEELIRKNNQAYFDLLANSNSNLQHLVPLPGAEDGGSVEAVSGVAGSAEAMYLRNEEVETLSIKLEQALLDLRDAITINVPSLLPLVHSLSDELRQERALAHQQKVALVMKMTSHKKKAGVNDLQKSSATSTIDDGSRSRRQQSGVSSAKTNMSVSFAADSSIGASVMSRLATSARTPVVDSGSSGVSGRRNYGQQQSSSSAKKQSHLKQHSFSNVNHQDELVQDDGSCHCNMSQHPHQHHPNNHDSIIFADGASTMSVMGSGKVGGKPKMAFFRRVE